MVREATGCCHLCICLRSTESVAQIHITTLLLCNASDKEHKSGSHNEKFPEKRLVDLRSFTFSIPSIIIQLIQFKPTNALNFIKITTILRKPAPMCFETQRLIIREHEIVQNIALTFSCMQQSCWKFLSV